MKFKYVGPHDAVDLPGVATDIEREHGRVEVTGELAEALDRDPDWQRVDRPKPKKKAAAKKAAAPKTPAAPAAKTTED
jgi:hypothetical protein